MATWYRSQQHPTAIPRTTGELGRYTQNRLTKPSSTSVRNRKRHSHLIPLPTFSASTVSDRGTPINVEVNSDERSVLPRRPVPLMRAPDADSGR
jgi:hypothetical protein